MIWYLDQGYYFFNKGFDDVSELISGMWMYTRIVKQW